MSVSRLAEFFSPAVSLTRVFHYCSHEETTMNKYLLVAAGLLVSSFGFAAQTTTPQNNGFSWSYADVGITVHDYDTHDGPDANGTSLDGNLRLAIDDHLYALGGLSYGWLHSTRLWDLHGGLGFHTPLVKNLDFLGEGEINLDRVHDHGHHDSEAGFTLRTGVRNRTTDQLELTGGVYYSNIWESDAGLFGEAVYHLQKPLSIGAKLTLGDDETAFGLFGRYAF